MAAWRGETARFEADPPTMAFDSQARIGQTGHARWRLWAATAAITVLTACAPQIDWHGTYPSVDQLAQIEPGKTGRATVRALLGGASSTSNFDDRTWYYIGQRTERFAFYPPEVIDRQVIFIAFDDNDRVAAIGKLDKEDGREIVFVDRTTATAGQRITLLQQLIGNIGQFKAPSDQE